jgi:hypothetical protein
MTPAQLNLIPDRMIFQSKTSRLREWLHARGLTMTLAELEDERTRRRPQ